MQCSAAGKPCGQLCAVGHCTAWSAGQCWDSWSVGVLHTPQRCVASDASARRVLDALLSCRARGRCWTLEVDSWEDRQTAVVVPQDSCSAARSVMISCSCVSETNSRCSAGDAMSKTNEMSNSWCAHSQLDGGIASPTAGCTNNVTPVSRDRI